jgi:hypothetical protein
MDWGHRSQEFVAQKGIDALPEGHIVIHGAEQDTQQITVGQEIQQPEAEGEPEQPGADVPQTVQESRPLGGILVPRQEQQDERNNGNEEKKGQHHLL